MSEKEKTGIGERLIVEFLFTTGYLCLLYLYSSFCSLNFDPTVWSEYTRTNFSYAAILSIGFAYVGCVYVKRIETEKPDIGQQLLVIVSTASICGLLVYLLQSFSILNLDLLTWNQNVRERAGAVILFSFILGAQLGLYFDRIVLNNITEE